MAKVILIRNNEEIGEWTLKDTPLVVGSGEGTQIRIDNPYMSQKHCLIGMGKKGYIFDLGSEIGTFVNNKKVIKSALNTGDTVDFGEYRLLFIERPEDRADIGQKDFDMTMDDKYEGKASEGSSIQWILNISDKEGEKKIYISDPVCIIGTSDECDVVLKGKKISDKHAAFIKDSLGLRLVNISNKKKLILNGRFAGLRTVLSAGDEVSVGTAKVTVNQE